MDRKDLDRFYADNVGLVRKIAYKASQRLGAIGVPLDASELEQELSEVFIHTFDHFDESLGLKFSTYFQRSAYNQINKIAKKAEIERVDNGTRSVEEMSDWLNDESDVAEVIECLSVHRPEQIVEAQDLLNAAMTSLSPLASMLLEMTISPPELIEREFEAHQAFASFARDAGHARRSGRNLNIAFVCSVLEKTTEIPLIKLKEARMEVEQFFGR